MIYPATVWILHGKPSWPIATRLAMDLIGDGFDATPVALDTLNFEGPHSPFPETTSLVVLYDGTWFTEPMQAALREAKEVRGGRASFDSDAHTVPQCHRARHVGAAEVPGDDVVRLSVHPNGRKAAAAGAIDHEPPDVLPELAGPSRWSITVNTDVPSSSTIGVPA